MGAGQEREGAARRTGPFVVLVVPPIPLAESQKRGVSQILRSVRGAPKRAGCDAERLGAARRVLRAGAELQECAGGGVVRGQRAGGGVRQPDRIGPSKPADRLPIPRVTAAEAEIAGPPPLRYVRPDPL